MKTIRFLTVLILIITGSLQAQKLVHHQVKAKVDPYTRFVEAVDKITIPENMAKKTISFLLVKDLKVESLTSGVEIRRIAKKIVKKDFGMDVEDFSSTSGFSQNRYAVTFEESCKGKAEFTLKFSGKIHYELERVGGEYDRGFSRTPGMISEKGVYLAGSSCWIPWFSKDLITYELEVAVPEAWDVVSHGKRTLHKKENNQRIVKWECFNPTEEIFIIAAKFHEYTMDAGSARIMAFLRTPDENLAGKYLETTAQYMEMYRKLIGPFPYAKFALVENFWETGYGMPSFTLLGPKIIRFPFILHSSYPHELLHNYWGNSVFVDFEKGNWCEGITVYMADHLIKEQRGQGLAYRRNKLQRYTDYVTPENDFPLTRFLSRNSAATEAVGYGKSMMVMDMLREKVGDELFVRGFQTFNRNNRFRAAGFDDIRIAFEDVTGEDLKSFFDQWIKRTGAPELRISEVSSGKKENEYVLSFVLNQIQDDPVFDLDIPVAVSFAREMQIKKVKMSKKKQRFSITLNKKPLLVQVDPRFNVFRRLHYAEIPPSFSKIFGSEKIMIVLPAKAEPAKLVAYRKLAEKWSSNKKKNIVVKLDNEISQLPADRDVWVFGQKNLFARTIVEGISAYDAQITPDFVRFEKTQLGTENQSFVVSVRHPQNHSAVVAWLALGNPESVDTLARKLMHYGKYSFLGFQGKEVTNSAKGQWQAVDSPMLVELEKNASKNAFSKLPKRKPLAVLAPVFSADRMLEHIKFLAAEELKGRGPGTPGIRQAADYIAARFKEIGLKPGGDDGTWFQNFTTVINEKGKKGAVRNVIGYIPGTSPKYSGESVVVSAHFDHLGLGWPDVKRGNRGKVHNGADDNASGVAVLLELAQVLKRTVKPQRAIVFVAFTAEENGMLGSKYYVDHYKKFPVKKVVGNINLDTVGRLNDKKLMVLNSSSAREWKFIFMGAGYVTGVASEMVSQQITASDQQSFIAAGVPGVQIFSGAHMDYHTPKDDIEKIDPAGLVRVAAFTREAVLYLGNTKKYLHFMGKTESEALKSAKPGPQKKGGRRVSTGMMPDFAFRGKGVRAAAVMKNSPAFDAGIRKGDVIVSLNARETSDLRTYSQVMKTFAPGQEISITFVRSKKKITARLTLAER